MPVSIKQYQQGKLESAAVGVPAQDQSGVIIGQGLQQLGKGISSMAADFEQANEVQAGYVAEEWAQKRNEAVAQAEVRLRKQYALDPENFDGAFNAEVEGIDDTYRMQVPGSRAKDKFERYTNASRSNMRIKALEGMASQIKQQNYVSAAARPVTAFAAAPVPTLASDIDVTLNNITTARNLLHNDASMAYSLDGKQAPVIDSAAKNRFSGVIEEFMNNDAVQAKMLFDDPVQVKKMIDSGLLDANDVGRYRNAADTAVTTRNARESADEIVGFYKEANALGLGQTDGDVLGDLSEQISRMEMQLVRARETNVPQDQIDRMTKNLNRRYNLVKVANEHGDRLNFATRKEGEVIVNEVEAEAYSGLLLDRAKVAISKIYKLDKETQLPVSQGGAKELVQTFDDLADIQVAVMEGQMSGKLDSKSALKIKQAITKVAVGIQLHDTRGDMRGINYGADKFGESVQLADQLVSATSRLSLQYAQKRQDLDATARADVAVVAMQESTEALSKILSSEEYKQRMQSAPSDRDRVEIQRNAVAEAYAAGKMISQNRWAAQNGEPAIGGVYEVGGAWYQVTDYQNSLGHYAVKLMPEKDGPQAKKRAEQEQRKAGVREFYNFLLTGGSSVTESIKQVKNDR